METGRQSSASLQMFKQKPIRVILNMHYFRGTRRQTTQSHRHTHTASARNETNSHSITASEQVYRDRKYRVYKPLPPSSLNNQPSSFIFHLSSFILHTHTSPHPPNSDPPPSSIAPTSTRLSYRRNIAAPMASRSAS